jgi:hypothetical protein
MIGSFNSILAEAGGGLAASANLIIMGLLL